MNLYTGKTMAERKQIDRDLRERARPKMRFLMSEIRYRPNLLTTVMEPYAHKVRVGPYRRGQRLA